MNRVALKLSFPHTLCHSRTLYVIPAPFMSFPRRRESSFTRRGGCSNLIESADGRPVADYSKFNRLIKEPTHENNTTGARSCKNTPLLRGSEAFSGFAA